MNLFRLISWQTTKRKEKNPSVGHMITSNTMVENPRKTGKTYIIGELTGMLGCEKKWATIKDLESKYQRTAREIYAKVHISNENNWRKVCGMVEVDNPDLRRQGQLYKELKKMFPDSNSQKYSNAEKRRLQEWKDMLTPEELQRHDLNFRQQEQIIRLQFHAPKKA